jgi:hypothetical protein
MLSDLRPGAAPSRLRGVSTSKRTRKRLRKSLEILTESQLLFVRAWIKEGVDGFYASTQGSEAKRFSTAAIFSKYVKPFDLVSMKEIASVCPFNILHVCDYVAPYSNYDAVYDYPGHVVNCKRRAFRRADYRARNHEAVQMAPYWGAWTATALLVRERLRRLKQKSGGSEELPASLHSRSRLHRRNRH